ncbi:hypothetical protein GN156_07145 [bacterium LRH843]|nr:hypothetical protein [bacterium LRH843]
MNIATLPHTLRKRLKSVQNELLLRALLFCRKINYYINKALYIVISKGSNGITLQPRSFPYLERMDFSFDKHRVKPVVVKLKDEQISKAAAEFWEMVK